jgi:hypothetical protein
MNVEIGTEAAQFPEKEDINGDFPCSVCYYFVQYSLFCLGQVTKRTATSVSKSVDDSTSWVRYSSYATFILLF